MKKEDKIEVGQKIRREAEGEAQEIEIDQEKEDTIRDLVQIKRRRALQQLQEVT